MSVTRETVEYIANLARLELSEDEVGQFVRDFNNILNYMELLNQVDTDEVEPLEHVIEPSHEYRKDVALAPLNHDLAMKNAPDTDGDYFRVPKVIE